MKNEETGDEMIFNEEIETLENRVGRPDVFSELDTQIVKEESPSQTVIKKMFLPKGIIDKSDLDDEEIEPLSKLLFFCDKFKLTSGDKLINFFLALRVSRDRLGRTEGFSTVQTENELKMKGNQPTLSFFGGKLPSI